MRCKSLLAGTWVALSGALCATSVGAQAPRSCLDSASTTSRNYKSNYEALVSLTDSASVARRARTGIPTLLPSEVRLVTDSAACQTASAAYDSALKLPRPEVPVVVLQLGDKWLVVRTAENGGRSLNMLFNNTFATLLNSFWL